MATKPPIPKPAGGDQKKKKRGILSLTIKDKISLFSAYMPYIRNGGIFIPTNNIYELGEDVFMLITLFDSKDKMPVAGKVVWRTPKGAQLSRIQGIGVQFSTLDKGETRSRIEKQLIGMLSSARKTHTL